MSNSSEWENLRRKLEEIAKAAKAFNAYVLDAWDNFWCAAHGFSQSSHEDLVALIHLGVTRARAPLHRGGKLDDCISGRTGHVYLRTYASCYVLLLRFGGRFDEEATRIIVTAALPQLGALTLGLPPPGGPSGHEAGSRA